MSRLITAAFDAYPAVLNGFFFGLIAASAVVIYRITDVDTPGRIGALLFGALLAFFVSGATESDGEASLLLVFLAGAIAISAMVLPGISGAAFLYILGQYEYMLGALTEFTDALVGLLQGGTVDAVVEPGAPVVVFMVGALLGLLTMARLVQRALERNRMATLGFLVGLMFGALRLPVEEAAAETEVWTAGLLVAIGLAVIVGAAVVLGFDHYTDSLDYTEGTRTERKVQ
jgi:putative membrane protein